MTAQLGNLQMVEALNAVEKQVLKRPADSLLVSVVIPRASNRNFCYLKDNEVVSLTVVADYSTIQHTGEYSPCRVYGNKAFVRYTDRGTYEVGIVPTKQNKFECSCGKWVFSLQAETVCPQCGNILKKGKEAKFKLNKPLYQKVKQQLDSRNYHDDAFLPEIYLVMPTDECPVAPVALGTVATEVAASFNRRGMTLIPYELLKNATVPPTAKAVLVGRYITTNWFPTEGLKAREPYIRRLIPDFIGR